MPSFANLARRKFRGSRSGAARITGGCSGTRLFIHASLIAAATATAATADDGKTTFGGKTFLDLTHVSRYSDDDGAPSHTGFEIKRLYLSLTHDFDKTWSANVTSDSNYTPNNGHAEIFIKKAYVQARVSDAFIARAGAADLPWAPFADNLYGYRYVEKGLLDRLQFGATADWGLHAAGKLLDGQLNYATSIITGNGYRNLTLSRSVDIEGRVAFTAPQGFTAALGFYSGRFGRDGRPVATAVQHTANRFDALVAYVVPGIRFGAEYFAARDWNQVTAHASDRSDGYSIWGAYTIQPGLAVFARADRAKPAKDLRPSLKDTYLNAGIAYTPAKNVDIALAYKHDRVEQNSLSTGNGVIGGVSGGHYREVGVWAQIQF